MNGRPRLTIIDPVADALMAAAIKELREKGGNWRWVFRGADGASE